MKILLIASIVLAVLTGCAQKEQIAADVRGREENATQVTVKAGATKELCFESRKDDEIFFRFEANRTLEFNLHYHFDQQTFYPVPEHTTIAEKGQFLVPKDDTYCLMWTNKHDTNIGLSVNVDGIDNKTWD